MGMRLVHAVRVFALVLDRSPWLRILDRPTMKILKFVIPGTPVAKGRPRFTRRGFAFTPAKTRANESMVQAVAREAMEGHVMLTGPIVVDLVAVMPIAESWSKTKKSDALSGSIYPTSKPDLDNLEKLILDSFNGIVWGDDSQVVVKTGRKVYGPVPMTTVSVWQQV
jgi:Holliday junction resolvase RusA-like endonuclease